ncbi:MAG: hypothetical protein H0T89_35565 [Deltaproteobacteria bacterium]|nr:hypothetical protein [Deltaproteobacteria bacterium]
MISRLLLALALVCISTACGEKKAAPQKLRKMAFKVQIDQAGRMMPLLELFDEKHKLMTVVGSYTMTVSRPDGTVLCSVTRPLAKTDFTDKHAYKATWQDAACPADAAAPEVRVNLEVKTGDAADAPKLAREMTTPIKFVYPHLAKPATDATQPSSSVDPTKLPAEAPLPEPAPGSAAGSSAASAAGTGSASGSAAVMGSASDAPRPPPDGSAGSAR